MSSTTVAIELLYDRIDVVTVRKGRAATARRIPVALPGQGAEWVKAVKGLGGPLKALVDDMDLAGARANVIYRSPTQAVSLASYRLRSAADACRAAMLTCTEGLPFPASSAVCRAVVVGRDAGGPGPMTHVVVAADRSDAVRAIVDMVEGAGLAFESLTPVDAPTIARITAEGLRAGGARRGWLHIGESSSFFLVCGDRTLRFERPIAIGTSTIVQSLTRPIRLPGGDDTIELDGETARNILHEHGIPDADEVVHQDPLLTRRHIMPLIQPVLQRFIIELRQSLRFGVPDEVERKSIAVTVTGPGSGIPGLASLFAWELRIEVAADAARPFDHRRPASEGSEVVNAIRARALLTRLNLQPAERAARRRADGIRRALWAGSAAALVLLAADWYRHQAGVQAARAEFAELTATSATAEKVLRKGERLMTATGALHALQDRIDEQMGASVDLESVLKELGRLAPESIRLSSVQFRRESQAVRGRISGRAAPVAPPELRTDLQGFVDRLKSSPLFESVVLRNVTADPAGPQAGQRFDAWFGLVPVPDAALRELASAPDDDAGWSDP